jgi:hypothetical protein
MNAELHSALLEVRKATESNQSATGICDLFSEALLGEDHDLRVKLSKELRNLMRQWPEYSGDAVFPVPAPDGSCPEVCYVRARNLWGFDDYGRARRRLLTWLIETTAP